MALANNVQSRGRDAMAANLDVATRSMAGCWPLPDLRELESQLRAAGFASTTRTQLMLGSAYYGITARC